jgi:hypothetical protein
MRIKKRPSSLKKSLFAVKTASKQLNLAKNNKINSAK